MPRVDRFPDFRVPILRLIDSSERQHGRTPTIRWLADYVDVGVSTMHGYVQRLVSEGLVEWRPRTHRSLRCTDAATRLLN